MALTAEDRKSLGFGAWVFALLGLAFAFFALWMAADALGRSSDAQDEAAKANSPKVVETEFKLSPSAVVAVVDGSINVENAGKIVHNLEITGTDRKSGDIQPGESKLLSLEGLDAGTYEMYCAIPGHASSGMKGTVTIGRGGMAGGTSDAEEAAIRRANAGQDASAKAAVLAYVDQLQNGANTKGLGNVPLEPVIEPDGTKVFNLTAEIVDWEVSPGQTVRAWTYNGTVPGPLIQVDSGDKVRIHLENELPQSTEIHFHGLEVPVSEDGVPYVTNDGPVKPGGSRDYVFTAQSTPATGMYHSHHNAEKQVPDGLVGVFLVGELPIPQGFGRPSSNQSMILNDAGAIGLSLNGKSFPATLPIQAKVGETVEVTYYNEGLQIHPMHLHGIPQTVIAMDGFPLPQPHQEDTVMVAPGQRVTVLIRPTAAQTGVWAYHCHILNHAEASTGMFGMVTTFIVS
ncbi:MAG: multicopper oxidase domain-containing protein [Actinomycetes bacterium]